jgi:integrase
MNHVNGYVIDPIKIDRRLEDATKGITNAEKISPENKDIILKYRDYVLYTKKLSKDRVVKWMSTLQVLGQWTDKPFDCMTVEDLKELDKRILSSNYADNSKCDLERMLKCFYKWIKSPDKDSELNEFPPEVKWLRVVRPRTEPLKNEDTISHEDVIAIKNKSIQARDKAFVYTLWDSCDRIREHLMLKVGDVEDLGKDGLDLNVKITKTGGHIFKKTVMLSEGDLRDWLKVHPRANDPKAPLWIRIDGREPNEGMDYFYARKILQVLSKKAGVKKATNPHNFRHGGLSYWSDYLTDSQLKYRAGWSQSTKMFATYIHKDLDIMRDAMLQALGRKPKEQTDPFKDKFQICPVCGTQQDKTRSICYDCGAIIDQRKNTILKEVMAYVDSRIKEAGGPKNG